MTSPPEAFRSSPPPAMGEKPPGGSGGSINKEDARDARLKLNTTLEERIGKEWRAQALEACDMAVKAYWVCRQEAGLSVIWKCRGANDAMKGCIAEYTGNKEAWEAYRGERLAVLAPGYFAHRERMLAAKLEHYTAALNGPGSSGTGSTSSDGVGGKAHAASQQQDAASRPER